MKKMSFYPYPRDLGFIRGVDVVNFTARLVDKEESPNPQCDPTLYTLPNLMAASVPLEHVNPSVLDPSFDDAAQVFFENFAEVENDNTD